MDKKQFGIYIKETRIKNGLTQKDLADDLYVDVTTVSKWERGVSYPDITLIPDICKFLKVSEHELIESSNDTEYRKMKLDAKKYNKTKNLIFYISSISYLVAIFVCFLCNLLVNHTLSWFFIVLTSCICAFTFIPTCLRFVKKYKLIIFVASTFISLFLLYLTCSIYTKDYWFLIATSGTLLGYFALFYPILFFKQKSYLKENTFKKLSPFFLISYSIGLYLLTSLLLVFVNAYIKIDLSKSLAITSYSFIVLYIYGIAFLLKTNNRIRLGISFILTSCYLLGLAKVLRYFLENTSALYEVNLKDWNNHSNGNVQLIVLISFLLVGIIFIVLGFIRKNKKEYE